MKYLILFAVVFLYTLDLGSSFVGIAGIAAMNRASLSRMVSGALGRHTAGNSVPRVSVETNARNLDRLITHTFGGSGIAGVSVSRGVFGRRLNPNKAAPAEEMFDVLLVLDSSGSIGSSEFIKAKQFMTDIISILPATISRDNTRVAAMSFSEASKIKTEFDFLKYTNKNDVIRALNSVPYQNGASTHTTQALQRAQQLFASSGRPGAKKCVFIATDGRSNGGGNPAVPAREIKNSDRADATIVVIAVSNNVNVDEVTAIASSPASEHVYYVNSFTEAKSVSKMALDARLARINRRHRQ